MISHLDLASMFACSLPFMLGWAMTSVVVCVQDYSILIIDLRKCLSRCLLCKVGCLILLFNRYRTLRQYVKIYIGSSQYVVVRSWRVWCIAIIYACNMFCSPSSQYVIFRILMGFYMLSCLFTFLVSLSCFFRWFE